MSIRVAGLVISALGVVASGAVLVRFVNDRQEGVGFGFDLSLTGSVR